MRFSGLPAVPVEDYSQLVGWQTQQGDIMISWERVLFWPMTSWESEINDCRIAYLEGKTKEYVLRVSCIFVMIAGTLAGVALWAMLPDVINLPGGYLTINTLYPEASQITALIIWLGGMKLWVWRWKTTHVEFAFGWGSFIQAVLFALLWSSILWNVIVLLILL